MVERGLQNAFDFKWSKSDRVLKKYMGVCPDAEAEPGFVLEKSVLRNFAKFTGKHLCQRLLFNKFAGLRTTASVDGNAFSVVLK